MKRSKTEDRTDYQVAVTVDGRPIEPNLVYPFWQSDPFPGGHNYTLEISGDAVQRIFERVKPGSHENPDMFLTQAVFDELEFFLYRYCGKPDSFGHTYFLNSIQNMSLNANQLKLFGECSDVQK